MASLCACVLPIRFSLSFFSSFSCASLLIRETGAALAFRTREDVRSAAAARRLIFVDLDRSDDPALFESEANSVTKETTSALYQQCRPDHPRMALPSPSPREWESQGDRYARSKFKHFSEGEIYDTRENSVFTLCNTDRGRSPYQRVLASASFRRTDLGAGGRRGGGSARRLARVYRAQCPIVTGVLPSFLSQPRVGAGGMQGSASTGPASP
jgi:hypothetical protein